VTTLAPATMKQFIDALHGELQINFMLGTTTFPPYSVGEVGRVVRPASRDAVTANWHAARFRPVLPASTISLHRSVSCRRSRVERPLDGVGLRRFLVDDGCRRFR